MNVLAKAILGIMLLALVVPAVGAVSISPAFGAYTNGCSQQNPGEFTCPNGIQIPVSFTITAPYAPYYGNLTVYPVLGTQEGSVQNFYGAPCTVGSSQTVMCYTYLLAISPFAGNGTETKTLSFNLVSSNYPAVYYTQTMNVTVNYYNSPVVQQVVDDYNGVNATYTLESSAYGVACSDYSICNATIQTSLGTAGNYLSLAAIQINASSTQAGFYNVTAANMTLTGMESSYTPFIVAANRTATYDNAAKANIANATSDYQLNQGWLASCTFSNGTTYDSYLSNGITQLNSYPTQNTESGASSYLNTTQQFSNKENSLIKTCKGVPTPTTSNGFSLGNLNVSMPPGIMLYIVVAVIVALVAYSVFRINEHRMVTRIRKGEPEEPKAPAPQQPAATDGTAPAKQTEPEGPSALEQSFDNWLSDHIGKKGD